VQINIYLIKSQIPLLIKHSFNVVKRILNYNYSIQLFKNMQSLTIYSNAGAFEGSIILFIYDTLHLDELIKKIKKLPGMDSVNRFQVEEKLPLITN